MDAVEVGALLRAARAGRQVAFTRLLEIHQPGVLRIALAMTGRREDAQDAAQEVFLRFFRALDRLDAERGLHAWLRTTTVRVCLDLLAKRNRREALGDDAETLAASDLTRRDEAVGLPAALQKLTVRERAAFLLVYQFGFSTAEAGAALDCAAGTIKTLCFRARGKMRPILRGEVKT